MLQAFFWFIFLISMHINTDFKYKNTKYTVAIFLFSFTYLVSIVISSIITYYLKSFDYLWIYMLVSMYFALLLISPYTISYNIVKKINFEISIFLLTIYVVSIGVIEQLGIIPIMPGSWYFFDMVRPSSTLGSMQHYAITLAILSFINLEFYLNNLKLRYLLSGLIALFASLFSFTRSGAMIIAIGFSLYFIVSLYRLLIYLKISRINLLFVIVFLVLSTTLLIFFNETVFIDRILSSVNLNEAGNSIRLNWWKKGMELWKETNILFGSYSGYITNATNRLSAGNSFVVESSLIQQLLNFGLIGCISFYILLILQFFCINNKHLFLRCCMIASILQTLVFQSIETIPFMVSLTLMPIISNNLCSGNTY